MRILANFTKKVSTGQFENEQFMVTIEAESEFNGISGICDYLFAEARNAVERQISGTAASNAPTTSIPAAPAAASTDKAETTTDTTQQKPAGANGNGSNGGNGNGNGYPSTEKQRSMIQKLLKENFRDSAEAKRWLAEYAGADKTTALSRKAASRAIEALMDRKRSS